MLRIFCSLFEPWQPVTPDQMVSIDEPSHQAQCRKNIHKLLKDEFPVGDILRRPTRAPSSSLTLPTPISSRKNMARWNISREIRAWPAMLTSQRTLN